MGSFYHTASRRLPKAMARRSPCGRGDLGGRAGTADRRLPTCAEVSITCCGSIHRSRYGRVPSPPTCAGPKCRVGLVRGAWLRTQPLADIDGHGRHGGGRRLYPQAGAQGLGRTGRADAARLLRYHLTTSDAALFKRAGSHLQPDAHGKLSGVDPAGATRGIALCPATGTERNAA